MSNVAKMKDETPLSPEAEQAVLGQLLLTPELVGIVVTSGGTDLFCDPLHADIFEAIRAKDAAGELVSPITVADAMRGRDFGVAGCGYLARLAGASHGVASFRGYVDLLCDLARKRKIAAAISDAAAAIARGDDAADLIAGRLEAALIASEGASRRSGPVSMLVAVKTAMEQIRAAYSGEDGAAVRTGIPELDEIISGLYPGELVLLGGRPSMGKTGVALAIALNAARAGHGVCIASLEMNPEAMAMRALSEATANARNAIYYSKMRRGDLTEPQVDTLRAVARQVADLPIAFLSREHEDIGALIAGAKQAHRTMPGGLRLLVVDYVQILKAQGRDRYEKITELSTAIKRLSGQLNIPILALSQLSRQVESRDDKRPMLSDLRESGQLEQDADTVLFCYRDEYYLEREQPTSPDKEEAWRACLERSRNRLEIIVAKQRQGEVRTAHVRFNPATNLIWSDRYGH